MAKTALISVSDKSGLEPFAKALVEEFGFRILSTGGTAARLGAAGIPLTEVSAYTGFPEMMEGRVKTLHPKVHGGLLARRDKPDHLAAAEAHGIDLIDLVVVNLYPFEATVAKAGVTREEAIENIDIGGPSMLRSAAKNFAGVTVVTDPADYDRVLNAFRENDADRLAALREALALKVFRRTSAYDAAIQAYLGASGGEMPAALHLDLPLAQTLRYGENPHQKAALYGSFHDGFEQLQGKELSYNNIIDITAAARLIEEYEKPTVAILKHTNPCGLASAGTLREAWDQAFATDRQAPFGGIIVMNRPMDADVAEAVREIFCEVIIAPEFLPEARQCFAKKKNLRLMIKKGRLSESGAFDIKGVIGGALLQEHDLAPIRREDFRVVTERHPTEDEWDAMLFGWKVVKHVKSNAIVYAAAERTLGIGAGQMSRVDSSQLAIWKAKAAGLPLRGSVICSDAFFPFPDALEAAGAAGATAAIQPGGSVRDDDMIATANQLGMTMVFTGIRHFRHG